MWRIVWSLCLGMMWLSGVEAQRTVKVDKKAFGLFQEAKETFRQGKTTKALELLEKAKHYDKDFSGIYLLQADIYHQKKETAQEIEAIETALALDSLENHPYYYLVLADHYFELPDYNKALAYYQQYLQKDKRLQMKIRAERQAANCCYALDVLQNQVKQPMEIFYKASLPVYWPVLDAIGHSLLFTEQEGDRETIWMLKDSMRYPVKFEASGNYGAPALTADGKTMYWAMDNGRNGFDIYVAHRLSDTTWSEPINLGYPVNTESWEAQPAISADGTRLYFASIREGGRGGSDIWCSRLLGYDPLGRQVWCRPYNLFFNTEGDEMAPFLYSDNNTLFFASDGYPGMGRKDIFKVHLSKREMPVNIGMPVNTQKDEFGFMVDGSGQWGYFSSDVEGKRCIYRYRLDEQIACPPVGYINLTVQDECENPVSPDQLILTDLESGDTLSYYGEGHTGEQMWACVPQNKRLLIGVLKRGYLYYSDTLQLKTGSWQPSFSYRVRLAPIHSNRTLVLKGVFFDTDNYRLKPESYAELRQLAEFLRLNPEVKIEISGHSDHTGKGGDYDRLSENRAFEIYKFLFLAHIPKDRMEYKGYRKNYPVAPNDTETGRAFNYRTEIRIK